jgi:hypothetical protein
MLTCEYTGLRLTSFDVHKAAGFSSSFKLFVKRMYWATMICTLKRYRRQIHSVEVTHRKCGAVERDKQNDHSRERDRQQFDQCCHKTSTSYLITLSARASTFGGIVRPICLGVFRLMMNSNFFGCSTGRSAGLAPFKILSTYIAARRNKSVTFAL